MSVDRWLKGFFRELKALGVKPMQEGSPDAARAQIRDVARLNGIGPVMHRVTDDCVATPGGGFVPVRILLPVARPRAVVIYYHGGGWIGGSIDSSETVARKLAERTDSAFVLVDYRLAPENPYPAAVEDAYAALQWVASRLDEIAGGEVPLIVAGDDAGGNLAAVVALRARDQRGPSIDRQILVCPILSFEADRSTPLDGENLWIGPETIEWFWKQYLADADRDQAHVSPLLATDLTGLPPAVVVMAEHSPARAGAERYAQRLRQAGVGVDFQLYPGQIHGFFNTLLLPQGERAFQQVIKAIRARSIRPAPLTL